VDRITPYIEKAVNSFIGALKHGRKSHWIVAPKGAGATRLAFEIAKSSGKKTLIVVGDAPGTVFQVKNFAKTYFANDEVYGFEYYYTNAANTDCNPKVLILERKHFNSVFLEDIIAMCDLVIYLDCERTLDSNDNEKTVFSRLKEKGSIIMGITSVVDPRIGLIFGDNPISTYFGEPPTCEISLKEFASFVQGEEINSNFDPAELRKAIEDVVVGYSDGTYFGITDGSTFTYCEGGPKKLVDRLEENLNQLLNRSNR
jgi:DNA or RNA helicases of superfamily II